MTLEEAKKQAMQKFNIPEAFLKVTEDEDTVFFTNTQAHKSYFWDKGSDCVCPVP